MLIEVWARYGVDGPSFHYPEEPGTKPVKNVQFLLSLLFIFVGLLSTVGARVELSSRSPLKVML